MTNSKTFSFDAHEFKQIAEVVEHVCMQSISESPPKFVIFMGGIGAGKTTLRRESYSKGFVNFDYYEIRKAIAKSMGEDNPKLSDFISMTSVYILQECIEKKKNIVIEIVGASYEWIQPIIGKMKDIGYDLELRPVVCDVEEARRRHLKAVEEDKDYMSSYFTEEATLSFFFNFFQLQTPPSTMEQ